MPSVHSGGADLSYRDSGGDGTPVVLLHGFPFDSELWDPQFETLGRSFRLVAPDLRGFGDSTPLPAASDLSMEVFAADLEALLDHLGAPRVVLGGLSMGGYVAFEFLRRHPERVSGLILADTRADADTPEARERRETQVRLVSDRGARSLVRPMVEALLSEETRDRNPEVATALTAVMQQDDRAWVGGLEAMIGRRDSTNLLGTIAVPTLVLVGERDGITPPQVARAMADRISGSTYVVIEGAGHVSNLEAPEAFNAALASFLGDL